MARDGEIVDKRVTWTPEQKAELLRIWQEGNATMPFKEMVKSLNHWCNANGAQPKKEVACKNMLNRLRGKVSSSKWTHEQLETLQDLLLDEELTLQQLTDKLNAIGKTKSIKWTKRIPNTVAKQADRYAPGRFKIRHSLASALMDVSDAESEDTVVFGMSGDEASSAESEQHEEDDDGGYVDHAYEHDEEELAGDTGMRGDETPVVNGGQQDEQGGGEERGAALCSKDGEDATLLTISRPSVTHARIDRELPTLALSNRRLCKRKKSHVAKDADADRSPPSDLLAFRFHEDGSDDDDDDDDDDDGGDNDDDNSNGGVVESPRKRSRSAEPLPSTATVVETNRPQGIVAEVLQTPEVEQPIAESKRDKARRVLSDAVSELILSDHRALVDAQWMEIVAATLAVQREPALDQQFVAAVNSLVSVLKHTASTGTTDVQADGVETIVAIWMELPHQDHGNVDLRLSPSDTEINQQARAAENAFVAANETTRSQPFQHAQAARAAITEIARACTLWIDRQESIFDCARQALSIGRDVQLRINELEVSLVTRVAQVDAAIHACESELQSAASAYIDHALALAAIVDRYKQQLLLSDTTVVHEDATYQAHAYVIKSPDPSIVEQRQRRDESRLRVVAKRTELARAKAERAFSLELKTLLDLVATHTQQSFAPSSNQVEQIKAEAEHNVEVNLTQLLAKMVHALESFFTFHTTRQRLARLKCREKELELTDLNCLFGPNAGHEIKSEIRRYDEAVMDSSAAMHDVASEQRALWDGKRGLFSPRFVVTINRQYSRLCDTLTDDAHEAMRGCCVDVGNIE